MIYADTSFLVSLYLTDSHSVEARRRVNSASQIFFTPLHRAEWAHTLSQHVFRGEISATQAREFDRHLESDQSEGFLAVVAMPEDAFETGANLAWRYGPALGLRTLDSLHVACAKLVQARQFWTFDERQRKLATAEGLKLLI